MSGGNYVSEIGMVQLLTVILEVSSDSSNELYISRKDRDASRVEGSEYRILEESHQISLSSLQTIMLTNE